MSRNFKQLSVKYRPKTTDDFIENEAAKAKVNSIVKKKDVHAILMHGTSGCGKTTLAKILANLLSTPGDIEDTNVSDKRGIEDVRRMIKDSMYMPSGPFKIFILDEVHALLGQAQSAILKTIEEPEHDRVMWILCTDRPHQLSVPLLNRLYKIKVEKPSQQGLAKYLYRIAKKERAFDFPDDRVKKICLEIAKASDCVPREALQFLKETADSQDSFENFKDLVINGIRKTTETTVDKTAMQILMAFYSNEKSTKDKESFLFTQLNACGDPWALSIRLCFIHQALMAFVGGVRGGPGYFYHKELVEHNAVPGLKQGVETSLRLVEMQSTLPGINVPPQQYVIPKIMSIFYGLND